LLPAASCMAMDELLSKLALQHYASKLKAEEVDLEALSLFEESDLVDLGVPKGPRVKLLRALQGVFSQAAPACLPEDAPGLQELAARLDSLGKHMSSIEQRLSSTCEELAAMVARQHAVEGRLEELALDHTDEPEEEGRMGSHSEDGSQDLAGTEELWERVHRLSLSMRAVQELAPSRVCWTIRRMSEKVAVLGPGKCLRAPSFALCGFVVGMKLEFYPNGRGRAPDGTDDRVLPEITPREHPTLREARRAAAPLPDEGWCSLGICCPMGIKMQYALQVGRSHKSEACHAQWTTVHHDYRVRWRNELEETDSLNIIITAVTIHNKRLRIQDDTVFLVAE